MGAGQACEEKCCAGRSNSSILEGRYPVLVPLHATSTSASSKIDSALTEL